jgi:hypothetical protein
MSSLVIVLFLLVSLSDIIITDEYSFVNTQFEKTGKNFSQIQSLFSPQKLHKPAAPKFRPQFGRTRESKQKSPFSWDFAAEFTQRAFLTIILLLTILCQKQQRFNDFNRHCEISSYSIFL